MGDAINVVIGRRARKECEAVYGGGHVKPSNRHRVARKPKTVTLSSCETRDYVGGASYTGIAQRHTWKAGYRTDPLR